MDPEDELADELAPEETSGEDPWHEEGWYFDLPAGAWERQEAKNRVLRDNIRANVKRDTSLRALEARRDPFHARDALLGLAQHADGPAWGEEMDDAPVSQRTGDAWLESELLDEEEPGSWKAELPDRKPRTTWQEEEPEPEWGAPEDLERRTGPRRPGAIAKQHEPTREEDAAWEPAPLRPRALRPQNAADDDALSEPEVEAGEVTPKRSRWDEMFGGPPDTSIIEAMRDWSSGAKTDEERGPRELTELPPELLQPFEWEEAGAMEPEAQVEAVADTPALARDVVGSDGDETKKRGPTADLFGYGQADDEARPESPPLAILEQSALDAGGWDTFAAKIAPAMPHSEPEKKSPRFAKLFGRGSERRDDSGSEWSIDPAAISEVRNAGGDSMRGPSPATPDPAALAGWEPMEASAEEPKRRTIDDDDAAELGTVQRGANRPGPGAWGAPPSDEDGSLKYELPRRFTDRDVWDDGWFEQPPGEDRVPVRPPQGLREEAPTAQVPEPAADAGVEHEIPAEASAESIEEDLARAYEEARQVAAPEFAEHAAERLEIEPPVPEEAIEPSPFLVDPASDDVAEARMEVVQQGPEAKSAESFGVEEADAERERGDAEGQAFAVEARLASDAEDEVLAMEDGRDADLMSEALEPQQPVRSVADDDPWAAFLVSRESDEPLGFRFTSDRDSRLAS
ncbi:MAG: hypothetical protein AB7T37_05320 [Dehalococcoidia bacterium]